MSFAAILCAVRSSADSASVLRANLHFAGQTLVEYQARQAVEAGASHVLIVVTAVSPALSQAVDRLCADGMTVELVRDMVTLIRDAPRDRDALLIADGAMIAQHHYTAIVQAPGNALLVTDDSRASAPFERIDAGQRWAGLARITPDLLFGTLDMIGDWDMELTLVRAAVQDGARRVTVPQDDLLEGRVVLVEGQQQADLAAHAAMAVRPPATDQRGGIEHYVLARLARAFAPLLMRTQVPPSQTRIAAIALGAIALIPIQLGWTGLGFVLMLVSLTLEGTARRLDELALRKPRMGGAGIVPSLFVLAGITIAGWSATTLYLVLLLTIILAADRLQRRGGARSWMIFTPGSAVTILLLAVIVSQFDGGMVMAIFCAIASVGAIILRRPPGLS